MSAERPDFARIYETYHGPVRAYAARLIGRDEAEDVTQEVFVKIERSLATLEDPARLSSWVYAITLNAVRDAVRKRALRLDRLAGDPGSRDGLEEEDPLARAPDPRSRTPEEIAIREEMFACYLGYVNQLPPHHLEVYILSELEQFSNADIARRLSVSVDTVKIRLHRARAQLHEALRRNCQCYHNERGELMGEPKRE